MTRRVLREEPIVLHMPPSDPLKTLPPIMCDRCHKPAPFGVKHRCPKGRRR